MSKDSGEFVHVKIASTIAELALVVGRPPEVRTPPLIRTL